MKKFAFREKLWEAISELPEEIQPEAYTAVINYAFTGRLPENPVVRCIVILIKDDLDKQRRRAGAVPESGESVPAESLMPDDTLPMKDSPAPVTAAGIPLNFPCKIKTVPKTIPFIADSGEHLLQFSGKVPVSAGGT